jgi:hypothetical protein
VSDERSTDLGEVLHEIRTPMTTSKGRLEVLLKHWDALPERRRMEMAATALMALNEVAFAIERNAPGLGGESRRNVPPVLLLDEQPERRRLRLIDLDINERTRPAKVTVCLSSGERTFCGESARRERRRAHHEAVARATLDAVSGVVGNEVTLRDAGIFEVGSDPLAVVTLHRGEDLLVGSALIEEDVNVATARATLDAINRFLA